MIECPFCEQGLLTPIQYNDFFQHNGTQILVRDLEGHVCDNENCDAAPIFTDQIRRNQVKITEAKKLVN